MKKILKRIMFASGYSIQRYSFMNRAIDAVIKMNPDPVFVQIGANNGIDFDDLYFNVTRKNLRGLVVEPVPDYFESLKWAYSYYPRVIPVHAALHPSLDVMTIYRVKKEAVSERWQNGIASFDKGHLIAHGIPDEGIRGENVDCMTFDTLICRHLGADVPVDILAIDTEGFDHEILKMVDFDKYRPSVIRYESKHLDKSLQSRLIDQFKAMGYLIHQTEEDCIVFDRRLRPTVLGALF